MVKYTIADIPMLEKDVSIDLFLYERAKSLLANFVEGTPSYISMKSSMEIHKYYYDLELTELNRLKSLRKIVVDGQISLFDEDN